MIRSIPFLLATLLPLFSLHAQDTPSYADSLTQTWTSAWGYSIKLPAAVKFNTIGSAVNRDGRSERANFIIPGGAGRIMVEYFTEPRMVPKNFQLRDSLHYADVDSVGRNGKIMRRTYIMKEIAVQIEVLLTPKGEPIYLPYVPAIFASFVPPPGSIMTLDHWRYGRDPKEYEHGNAMDRR